MSATYCRIAPSHPLHGPYHDTEYGVPAEDESVLFERLVLEINQAGLSWLTVLQKRAAFRAAFANYKVDRVARLGERDVARLLADPGIVRNRLKVAAVIDNARAIQQLRQSHGSFQGWLEAHHPRTLDEWTRLFRGTFRFTGGLIAHEFLMSLGYLPLPGAHEPDCPIYKRVLVLAPPWSRTSRAN
jgi:DNA-3-methyladenine glycosylase I